MRLRTAKAVASRIDLNYFKRPHPLRRGRTVLIALCVLAAAAWTAYAISKGDQRVYNPGPVTAAHAMFEQNCGVCHAGGGDGFVNKRLNPSHVTDAACLKCHDAAIHHANQATFVAAGASTQPSSGGAAAEMSAHSTNCTACHTEHRGHSSLAATFDANCLQCHRDLNAGKTKGPPVVQASVTGFEAPGSHPEFGRRLPRVDGKPHDGTRIRFNHSKHPATLVKPAPGAVENCTVCHSNSGDRTAAATFATTAPAAETAGGSVVATDGGDRRYTRPVNYNRHCAECHPIQLKGEDVKVAIPLPHVPLESLRGPLSSADVFIRQWFTSLPPEQQEGYLTVTKTESDAITGETTTTTTRVSPEEWLKRQVEAVKKASEQALEEASDDKNPGRAALVGLRQSRSPSPDDAAKPDPDVLEFQVARLAQYSCAYCHSMNDGDVPGVFRLKGFAAAAPGGGTTGTSTEPSAATPTTAPATQPSTPMLLATLPTGIPSNSPRRWFVGSVFDHDAHRAMKCLECHGQAPVSADTSQVLMPVRDSCVQCHHSPTSASRGAGADCQTCHLYHDRSRERLGNGGFTTHQLLGVGGAAGAAAK